MKNRRLVMIGASLCAAAVAYWGVQKFSVFGPIAGHTTPFATKQMPAYTRALRPNYPYSIIPGGAYSASELANADRDDDVVREHYSDFEMKKAHMVQLTEDRYQYASYRLKGKVYWTKKKLRIPKGEVLLTDGASYARARCGNRLSDKPHKEVSAFEPPLKALSSPPMQLGEPMELASAPPLNIQEVPPPDTITRFTPVLPPPPVVGQTPPEIPPLVPAPPIIPIVPVVPLTPPPPVTPPAGTPPPTTPPSTPPPVIPPPVIPPPDQPPVSAVPEPKEVYLFLITFVVSLYGLIRMMREEEGSAEAARDQ